MSWISGPSYNGPYLAEDTEQDTPVSLSKAGSAEAPDLGWAEIS